MFVRLVIATILTASLATPASAENWRRSSSADGSTAFIDVDSIARDGDRVRFWRELRLPAMRTLETGLRLDRIAAFYEADCSAMSFRTLTISAKLGNEVVMTGEGRGDTEVAEQGSTAEADLRSACFDEWPNAG